jgi:hypothetical protein
VGVIDYARRYYMMMNIGKIVTHGFKPSPKIIPNSFAININIMDGDNVSSWYDARKVITVIDLIILILIVTKGYGKQYLNRIQLYTSYYLLLLLLLIFVLLFNTLFNFTVNVLLIGYIILYVLIFTIAFVMMVSKEKT